MRIFIGGMNSRQSNPAVSNKDVTVASLMGRALEDRGHEIVHESPTLYHDFEDFDHAFVGIAALHSLGSNRVYGCLNAYLRLWTTGKLTLFIDDPDAGKVQSGIRTMINSPERLFKSFYQYKPNYYEAIKPPYKEWLTSGPIILGESQWPRLIVPWHSWSAQTAETAYSSKLPQAAGRIVGVDFTAWLPKYEAPEVSPEVQERWLVEGKSDDRWLRTQRPEFPVYHMAKGYEKRPYDEKLVELYRNSWGVLEIPQKPVGYWTSRIGYAAQAQVPYVTRWQDVSPLGDPYTVLADRISELDLDGRNGLAKAQYEALLKSTPTRDFTTKQLESCVMQEVVA